MHRMLPEERAAADAFLADEGLFTGYLRYLNQCAVGLVSASTVNWPSTAARILDPYGQATLLVTMADSAERAQLMF
jgi:hypothetical protein